MSLPSFDQIFISPFFFFSFFHSLSPPFFSIRNSHDALISPSLLRILRIFKVFWKFVAREREINRQRNFVIQFLYECIKIETRFTNRHQSFDPKRLKGKFNGVQFYLIKAKILTSKLPVASDLQLPISFTSTTSLCWLKLSPLISFNLSEERKYFGEKLEINFDCERKEARHPWSLSLLLINFDSPIFQQSLNEVRRNLLAGRWP